MSPKTPLKVAFALVIIINSFFTFSLYNRVKEIEAALSLLCDAQRLICLDILVKEELEIENENRHRNGLPRTGSDPFSEPPTGSQLQSGGNLSL